MEAVPPPDFEDFLGDGLELDSEESLLLELLEELFLYRALRYLLLFVFCFLTGVDPGLESSELHC